MEKHKILITGANGQLGKELIKVFALNWDVIPTDTDNLDITDKTQCEEFIKKERPDWLINSAAFTDVEGCAKDPEKANLINAQGNKNLAQALFGTEGRLVYISTNEVFDGEKDDPYSEGDQTNPINPYAVSKLNGEKLGQEILQDRFLIVRTSWLYGPESRVNFPNKIIKKALETGRLEVVDDEVSTPTYAPDLAQWIKSLVESSETGIFHLINDGSASRYDWAKQIVELKNLKVDLKKTKLENYTRLSTPPKHAVLSNAKAKTLGLKFRDWKEASKEYLENL